jgi:hypothetical protein
LCSSGLQVPFASCPTWMKWNELFYSEEEDEVSV